MVNYYYKRVGGHGNRITEHRLIIERAIGRKLRLNEQVHHKDGNTRNNNINNLMIVSASEHAKIHEIHRNHPHAKTYTLGCLTKMLIGYVERTGQIPTRHSLREVHWMPNEGTFVRRFGSWNKALEAAGLPTREPFGFAKRKELKQ